MARNASGTYSLPAGRPVVSGTVISATAENAFGSDLSTEITNSLDRTGKGAMLAELGLIDGTVGSPGVRFASETGSGLRRAGAGDVRLSILGADSFKALAGGLYSTLFGALAAASAIVKGAVADGVTAVGVILDNAVTLANAAAKVLSLRNNGTEVLAVDLNGAVLGPAAGASLVLKGTVADGATAVGVVLDNTVALANASAKLASFRSNASEKAYVNKDGKGFFVGADAGSQTITNVATPSASTDAANKAYVDLLGAWNRVTLAANQTLTGNTLANINNLTFTAAASKEIVWRLLLITDTGTMANTTTVSIAVALGGTPTGSASGTFYSTGGGPAQAFTGGTITGGQGNTLVNTVAEGHLNSGAGGTVTVQTCRGLVGESVVAVKGSYFEWIAV